jgi:hypothetical protein
VVLEPGAALPVAVGPKVPPVETMEPEVELDDDCSGCRTAAGQGQGRQHLLLTEEMLEPRAAEEPRAAGEQRHATGWQGRVRRGCKVLDG